MRQSLQWPIVYSSLHTDALWRTSGIFTELGRRSCSVNTRTQPQTGPGSRTNENPGIRSRTGCCLEYRVVHWHGGNEPGAYAFGTAVLRRSSICTCGAVFPALLIMSSIASLRFLELLQ